jgi:hypothetical protein
MTRDMPVPARVTVHPAALVLAGHYPVGGQWRDLYVAPTIHVRCSCGEWAGPARDHPAHQARVLAEAGLLADGTPPETPTTRVLGERADRRTT